jgi:radical SAM superfamily enzyme YgiQ (UPF0313 family)
MTSVLLLSTYELGHQPIGLARPAAHLMAAGHRVICNDLAVDPLDTEEVQRVEFVGISIPMHTATRLGVRLAEKVRRLNPTAHICFYGLYASLNAETLLGRYADSVIGGEYEQPMVRLVDSLASPSSGPPDPPKGVITLDGGELFLGRQHLAVPRRDLLPPLERYSRLDDGERQMLAGYVEASRGCAHRCLHCPITPVYAGRLRIVSMEVVLEDIRQLVDLGAEHITFGDPDFFNGVKYSCQIIEALHAEFPRLSYDVTIKVEHLLEHRALLPLLAQSGCRFVVTAVESIDDQVLANLQKGHSGYDVEIALGLTAAAGLVLRPTFVPFTPWTTLEGYSALLGFIERHELIYHVDPIQLSIRLLVPRGSSLLGTSAMAPHLSPFDDATFTYTWRHPDPRLDVLQGEIAALVEQAAHSHGDPGSTFYRIKDRALEALGEPIARPLVPAVSLAAAPVPRLTEAWFC